MLVFQPYITDLLGGVNVGAHMTSPIAGMEGVQTCVQSRHLQSVTPSHIPHSYAQPVWTDRAIRCLG